MNESEFRSHSARATIHGAILESCNTFSNRVAIVDTSEPSGEFASLTYARYGELIEAVAQGFVLNGMRPGDVVGIYLNNCWEFAVTYHAATMCGAIPTFLNPAYREREVRYQLQDSSAKLLVTDGALINTFDLAGLDSLRAIYCTRNHIPGTIPFSALRTNGTATHPALASSAQETLAALPYSSGTTGLPKGVMLSHYNLLSNVFQFLAEGQLRGLREDDVALCFLPLYHIYGLNVVLNPTLVKGATIVLMPRYERKSVLLLIQSHNITWIPSVPAVLNSLAEAAEQGDFPAHHHIRYTKSGAAPLAADLAERYTRFTGIPVVQGYGMTEASPVTHCGFLEPDLYRPSSIGRPVADTECRLVEENQSNGSKDYGQLVMRGPQFMRGYWNAPEATAEALRDGWYWSGDVATRDQNGFFQIVDRLKEMIKFKGFPISPAEIESVLMEHPLIRDCGVTGSPDIHAGEIPCAFVVLKPAASPSPMLQSELQSFVRDRLTSYKQPQQIHFIEAIPRSLSGKILRRELKLLLS